MTAPTTIALPTYDHAQTRAKTRNRPSTVAAWLTLCAALTPAPLLVAADQGHYVTALAAVPAGAALFVGTVWASQARDRAAVRREMGLR